MTMYDLMIKIQADMWEIVKMEDSEKARNVFIAFHRKIMQNNRRSEIMQEHRMENYEGQDIEFISVWGKIGKVDFANLTEALENASSEDVVEYILDHAREELEYVYGGLFGLGKRRSWNMHMMIRTTRHLDYWR